MNRSRTIKVLSAAIALSLVAAGAQAATRADLHQRDMNQARQQYQSFVASHGQTAVNLANRRHAAFMGASTSTNLMMRASRRLDNGVRNYRYDQTWRGIPIFGENLVVSEDRQGNVRSMFGNLVSGLDQDITNTRPSINAAQALVAGKRAGLGNSIAGMMTRNESSEVVVFIDDAGVGHLAYKVSFFADSQAAGHAHRPIVMIDAHSGAVLKQWDNLQTAEIGTGPGGNAKTGQYEYGVKYGKLDVTQSGSTCTMNNAQVKTVNLNNSSSNASTTAFSYSCPRNTVRRTSSSKSTYSSSSRSDLHDWMSRLPRSTTRSSGRRPEWEAGEPEKTWSTYGGVRSTTSGTNTIPRRARLVAWAGFFLFGSSGLATNFPARIWSTDSRREAIGTA